MAMAKFNERLRQLRTAKDLSQFEFAKQIGISKSSVNMYERGEREPNFKMLEVIADYFNVDMDYLLGKTNIPLKNSVESQILPSNIIPMPEMRKIPLLGTIACGAPVFAEEHMDGEVDIPSYIHADFALRCEGDSMINARIFNGDIAYIRKQDTVENGEIAAVLIENEATLKRVRLFDDHISLEPENPMYKPFVFWGEDMNSVHILGKAVAFTSVIR
jgi:repressor LexA